MNYPDFCYKDVALGTPANRNHVLKVAEIKPADQPAFVTWHRFNGDYLRHFQEHGSVRNYDGPSYADFLPFDFDGGDLEEVQNQVVAFVNYLESNHDIMHGYRLFFSGNKGFHVYLDAELFGNWTPSKALAGQLKELAQIVGGEFGGFDPSIYDRNRLLRMANTPYGNGLFKIPLTRQDLELSIQQIRELAAQPRSVDLPPMEDCLATDSLRLIWDGIKNPTRKVERERPRQNLFRRGLREGEGRDNNAYALIQELNKHGHTPAFIFNMMMMWDEQQQDKLGEQVIWEKIKRCCQKISTNPLGDFDDVLVKYQKYIDGLREGNRINTGMDQIDFYLRGISPGEVCTIIARSGVGKTMLAMNMTRWIAEKYPNVVVIFASLEMPLSRLAERYLAMTNRQSGREIERQYLDNQQGKLVIKLMESMGPETGNNLLFLEERLALGDVGEIMDWGYRKIGRPVGALFIDYFGYLEMPTRGSTYERLSETAREIKQVAKKFNIAIIDLCQVGREQGQDGTTPLKKHSARDTGAIEESADYLLGVYRPHMGEDDRQGQHSDRLYVQILKNRGGPERKTFSFGVAWEHGFILNEGVEEKDEQ